MNIWEELNVAGDVRRDLQRFVELLQKWGQVFRLVGSDTSEQLYDKHLADCFELLPLLKNANKIADLGTGAGLPGLVVAIVMRQVKVVLVESQQRRVNFCNQVRRELELENVHVVRGRAEDPSVIDEVGECDVVVSRATWKIGDYLQYAAPYLSRKGHVVAMKSEGWTNESKKLIMTCKELNLRLPIVYQYKLPLSNAGRVILEFERYNPA